VLSERVGAYKPKMHEQIAAVFPQLEAVENEVKLILAEAGTQTILNPAYINFGREVWRNTTKFSGGQLINAVNILLNKWVARGLDQDTLEKIRNTVFALAAPAPAP
jgi:hypothetical protein